MSLCRAVYDTNIIISANLTSGICYRLLYLAIFHIVDLIISENLLKEYREVLSRYKFHNTPEEVTAYLHLIEQVSTTVTTARKIRKILDDPDNRILECAIAGKVDYIVTGNKRHFSFPQFEGVKIISPTEFLRELEKIRLSR